MALPFGRLSQFPMPSYRPPQRQTPAFGLDMIPGQPQPQTLGLQGTMAMGPGGLQPMSSEAAPPASHPGMGIPDGRFFNVGGDAGQRSPGQRFQPPANQNFPIQAFGSGPIPDGRFFNVGNAPTAPRAAPAGGFDQHAFSYRPPAATGESLSGPRGFGERTPGAAPSSGFNWQPDPVVAPSFGGGGSSGPAAPRAQLAANAPNYGSALAGTSQSLPAGWWHDPTYSTSNAGGWWHDPSGAGQDLNRAMSGLTPYGTPLGTGPGGAPRGDAGFLGGYQSGGGGGGGGGGGNPLQSFVAAMNAANAANAARANNLNAGYSGLRKYAGGLLDQYSDQDKRDTNTAYDNAMSKSISSLVNSGLANSTITADQYARNARDRSAAMNRANDAVLGRRLDVELPLAQDQFKFNERIDQNAPDPRLLAQLAQGQAAAGGSYGAPMMIDSGDIPYQWPSYSFGGGMGGGYRVGSQLQHGNRKFGGGGFPSRNVPAAPYTGNPVLGRLLGIGGTGMTGGNGMSEPDLILNGGSGNASSGSGFFPPGMDFGGDWNFGGPRQNMPQFPWMYR